MQVRVKEGLRGEVRVYAGITFYKDGWRNIKDPEVIERLKSSTDSLEYRNKAEEVKDKIVDKVKGILKPKEKEEIVEGGYTEKQLNEMEFRELKSVGAKFGTTDRSKSRLIAEILKIQEDRKIEEEKLDKALEPDKTIVTPKEIPKEEQDKNFEERDKK